MKVITSLRMWLCKNLGWHKRPHEINIQYGLISGKCPVCEKDVMIDSQGNWY